MSMVSVRLDRLRPHPHNSNVMPADLLNKLVEHLRQNDRYPPIIVRPWPEQASPNQDPEPAYQILDGHHRVAALRRLDRDAARCVVWEVDDQDALLLLATLNRLQGQDDPRKRAALVGHLRAHLDFRALAQRLPEDTYRLKKLAQLNERRPPPRPPQRIADMPVALHFFLKPDQRTAVEHRLRERGGTREQALLELLGVAEALDAPTET